jgi:hypothetical protein
MTEEEIMARYQKSALKKPIQMRTKETQAIRLHQAILPDYVNWYEAGKVSESVD